MESIDLGQAIDVASKVLAGLVSFAGLVVVISQWTRPAALKRRAKWLQETIEHEQNEARRATLASMLSDANASLVAGALVPSWRFLTLAALMLLGPAQAFVWARNDANALNIIGALGFSLVLSTNPIRRGVRLLSERYRVAHEYRDGSGPVQPVRLGILNQMEGGTRIEMVFGLAAALGVNAASVGVALVYLDQPGWGWTIGLLGAALTLTTAWLINRHAQKRVSIYGPWSVEDPRL